MTESTAPATTTTSTPKSTPLRGTHEAAGAVMTDFGGWMMPLRYTSDLAEHRAVRENAGLFDLSHMGQIHVSGPHAAAALNYALVGNMSAIAVGRAKYTMICAPDGGVIDDLIVYRLGDVDFLVVANAGNTDTVVAELIARITGTGPDAPAFDATVMHNAAADALIAVQGPGAATIVTGLLSEQDATVVGQMKYYAAATVQLLADSQPIDALVARTGYTGEDGFELFIPADRATDLWTALLATGHLTPCGLAARDSLRLEAGMPLYGNELDQQTTPYEAGLGRIVALNKMDDAGAPLPFVGREALAAWARQTPARELVGLKGLGKRPARAGYDVVHGDDVVGAVTSGAPSPTLGHPIAMAYVLPEAAEVGTELGVDVRGRPEPVVVVPLPFYRRDKP